MENDQSLVNDEGGKESLETVANSLKAMILQKSSDDAASAVEYEMRRRSGLLGIMFPGRILKENEQLAVQNMKDVFQSRQQLMEAYINVQLELTKNQGKMIIKSKLQHYEGQLSLEAIQINANLGVFSQKKIAEMTETFARSRMDFAERLDRQHKEAEKYKGNEFLYEKLIKNLNKETEVFFTMVEELLDGFIKSLTNKLNQD